MILLMTSKWRRYTAVRVVQSSVQGVRERRVRERARTAMWMI